MPKTKENKLESDDGGSSVGGSRTSQTNNGVHQPDGSEAHVSQLDSLVFQALVNEGKHTKVLNAKRPSISYNGKDFRTMIVLVLTCLKSLHPKRITEKELRDAAHAEVAVAFGTLEEIDSADKKKRKFETEEKEKQR